MWYLVHRHARSSGMCSKYHDAHCPGGHLVIVGAAVGSKDEELASRNFTVESSAMLLELQAQCATSPTACNGGRISRISDANMSTYECAHATVQLLCLLELLHFLTCLGCNESAPLSLCFCCTCSYLGGKSNSGAIANAIVPAPNRKFVTTLPPWIRTNFFLHGLGPMVSVTFYVADASKNGTTGDTITLRTDAIPCFNKTTGGGACEFWLHNLPLDAMAAEPITPPTKMSADQTRVTVTLPAIGALAVLSVGAPGEASARRSAGQLRKAYERLKIATRAIGAPEDVALDSRCDHGGCDNSVPSWEAQSEQLLSMVQCGRARWLHVSPCEPHTIPCQSFVAMPDSARPRERFCSSCSTCRLNPNLTDVSLYCVLVNMTRSVDEGGDRFDDEVADSAFEYYCHSSGLADGQRRIDQGGCQKCCSRFQFWWRGRDFYWLDAGEPQQLLHNKFWVWLAFQHLGHSANQTKHNINV